MRRKPSAIDAVGDRELATFVGEDAAYAWNPGWARPLDRAPLSRLRGQRRDRRKVGRFDRAQHRRAKYVLRRWRCGILVEQRRRIIFERRERQRQQRRNDEQQQLERSGRVVQHGDVRRGVL
jgi:hypothetical protein